MPISPDDGARLAAAAGQIAHEAELRILQKVQEYLSAGMTAPDWVVKKQAQVAELRAYLERQATSLERSVARAVSDGIAEAYELGVDAAQADLAAAGRPALAFPPASIAALNLLARDVMNRTSGAIAQIVRTVPDAYQAAVASAAGDVLLGTATRRVAAQRAIDRLLGEGISGFTDSAGRNWYLPSYVEMATRTATGRAAIQGHVDTLKANGEGLLHVIPGPRPCPICDEWAGRVLAITQADLEPPAQHTLDEARAQGWGHPNCRCSTALYIEGYSTLSTERPGSDTYEDAQRQRAIERNIRHWKRKAALSLDDDRRAAANRKVREWQEALRGHLAAHPELKRLRYRESLTAMGYRAGGVPARTPRTPKAALPYRLNRPEVDINWPDEERARLIAGFRRARLQEAVSNGVSIRVTPTTLDRIVADGRIRNAYDVGGGAGQGDPWYLQSRATYERTMIGIPEDVPLAQHPIYGYGRTADISTDIDDYGDIEIHLKDTVKSRTTWTHGDSLISEARPLLSSEIDTASDNEILASGVKHQPYSNRNTPPPYIEAQVHGGVTLDDIEWVSGSGLSRATVEALRARGIEVR